MGNLLGILKYVRKSSKVPTKDQFCQSSSLHLVLLEAAEWLEPLYNTSPVLSCGESGAGQPQNSLLAFSSSTQQPRGFLSQALGSRCRGTASGGNHLRSCTASDGKTQLKSVLNVEWPWLHSCWRNMMQRDLNWIQKGLFISVGEVLEAELDE